MEPRSLHPPMPAKDYRRVRICSSSTAPVSRPEIALEDLDHMVRTPREVYLDDSPSGLASRQIIDGDGGRQVIKFRDPLMLPPPAERRGVDILTNAVKVEGVRRSLNKDLKSG